MDRFVTLLISWILAGSLVFFADRLPPVDYRVPIPFVGPHIRYESLKARGDRLQATLDARIAASAARSSLAAGISLDHAETLQKEIVQVRTVTRTLIEKVPLYVTPEDDRRCVVPAGAVSLLNAAVRGDADLPAFTGGLEQAPSGVPLSAVVDNGVFNLGVGHELLKEVLAWRAWHADLTDLYAEPLKP